MNKRFEIPQQELMRHDMNQTMMKLVEMATTQAEENLVKQFNELIKCGDIIVVESTEPKRLEIAHNVVAGVFGVRLLAMPKLKLRHQEKIDELTKRIEELEKELNWCLDSLEGKIKKARPQGDN